ncbi:microaggregate-binding protein 1 [Rhodococcus sp. W8901]|uniref:microaggregate-binding protein 1 n=1 Tax=Rhodococcus sp. W8901 TaxID=2742603 RepID=UPI001581ACD6|nr:CsbD family protein [Rhodococcus sp. W8901]QKT11711.1 CsbD family protein [Rhodococcus sp. W8901]
MTDKDKSGPTEAVKGTVEGVKGKAKEAAGAVTGQDDLVREGKAQQDKAAAQREAAEKARGKASANEARQRTEQDK